MGGRKYKSLPPRNLRLHAILFRQWVSGDVSWIGLNHSSWIGLSGLLWRPSIFKWEAVFWGSAGYNLIPHIIQSLDFCFILLKDTNPANCNYHGKCNCRLPGHLFLSCDLYSQLGGGDFKWQNLFIFWTVGAPLGKITFYLWCHFKLQLLILAALLSRIISIPMLYFCTQIIFSAWLKVMWVNKVTEGKQAWVWAIRRRPAKYTMIPCKPPWVL